MVMPVVRIVFWLAPKVLMLQRMIPPGVSAVKISPMPTTSDGIDWLNPDMISPVASAAAAASRPLSAAHHTDRVVSGRSVSPLELGSLGASSTRVSGVQGLGHWRISESGGGRSP